MEITNTKSLTEFIFTILKNRFDKLQWFLYPPVQNLNETLTLTANLSLSSFEIVKQSLDGRLLVDTNFTIHLIFKETELAHLTIRDAAFFISKFLYHNNFNHDQLGEIEITSNEPDYFQPEVEGYLSWKIDFSLPFACGDLAYEPNGVSEDIEIISRINHD